MTSTDAATLAGNAACINGCVPDGLKVPALISLFADIAGVSKDPSDLIRNSVTINCCIPLGLQMAALISLFAQIAGITPTTPRVNLIPAGAMYDGSLPPYIAGRYLLQGLQENTDYQVTWGVNEFSCAGGTAAIPNPGAGQITIINTGLTEALNFISAPGGYSGLVTAQVYAV